MYSKTLIITSLALCALAQTAYDAETELPLPAEDYAEEAEETPVIVDEDESSAKNETSTETEAPGNTTISGNDTDANSTVPEEENSGVQLRGGIIAGTAIMAAVAALLI